MFRRTDGVSRLGGFACITGGACLAAWWPLYGLLLPSYGTDFSKMASGPYWIHVNLLAFIGIILASFGLTILYTKQSNHIGTFGTIGFTLIFIGNILFIVEEFYQAFVWPVIAVHSPSLLALNGSLLADKFYVIKNYVFQLASGAGYMIFAASLFNIGEMPRWPLWFITLGSPLFYISPLIFDTFANTPLRATGLIILSTGFIGIGFSLSQMKRLYRY